MKKLFSVLSAIGIIFAVASCTKKVEVNTEKTDSVVVDTLKADSILIKDTVAVDSVK